MTVHNLTFCSCHRVLKYKLNFGFNVRSYCHPVVRFMNVHKQHLLQEEVYPSVLLLLYEGMRSVYFVCTCQKYTLESEVKVYLVHTEK